MNNYLIQVNTNNNINSSSNNNNTNTTGITAVIPFSRPQKKILDRPIRFKSFLQNTIFDALKGRGWQEVVE